MTVGPIKQRLTDAAPLLANMQPGQLFVDELNQTLWTAGLTTPIALPLGRQAFPTLSGVPTDVLIQTENGLAYGVWSAGGGGQPFATSDWIVPGVAPRAVTSFEIVTSYTHVIELALPATITAVRMTGGAANITLADINGAPLRIGSTTSFDPIALTAGLYKVVIEVATPTTFTALVGNLRGRPEQAYPVFFQIGVAV